MVYADAWSCRLRQIELYLDSCKLPLDIRVLGDALEEGWHDGNQQVDEYHRTSEEIDSIDEATGHLGDAVPCRVDANRLVRAMFHDWVGQNNTGVGLRLEAVERPVESRHRCTKITPSVRDLYLQWYFRSCREISFYFCSIFSFHLTSWQWCTAVLRV